MRRELATLVAAFGEDAWDDGRVAAIAEPAQLKGRRYGNVVLAAVAPGGGAPGLAGPGLARAVRSLAVPARVLVGGELRTFVGPATPLVDPHPSALPRGSRACAVDTDAQAGEQADHQAGRRADERAAERADERADERARPTSEG